MIVEIVDSGYEEAEDIGPDYACCIFIWISSHM
jgi:hypothetical protein